MSIDYGWWVSPSVSEVHTAGYWRKTCVDEIAISVGNIGVKVKRKAI